MNTRSKDLELYAYDLEVEKTLHLLKIFRIQSEHALEPKLEHHHDHAFDFVSLDSSSSSSEIIEAKKEARMTTEKVNQLKDDLRMIKEQFASNTKMLPLV